MHMDIFADVICPWCLIGKRRLERALQQQPQPDLTIRWRAFQLNPSMPAAGMDRETYLATKFGSEANAREIYGNIQRVAEADGLVVQFDRIDRTPNTLPIHRLLRYAADLDGDPDPGPGTGPGTGTSTLQSVLLDRLFQAYFCDGRNIGDPETLIDSAAAVGMDAAAVTAFLAGDRHADAVEAEDVFARHIGINGVPAYVFNGKHMLAGAQPPEVLVQLFDLARQDEAAITIKER